MVNRGNFSKEIDMKGDMEGSYKSGGPVVKTSCSPKGYKKGGRVKKGCFVKNAR